MAKVNFENRTLYHLDNLEVLRGMNSETVHLIATDPPFNKGKDFHATPDSLADGAGFADRWSWDRDVHEEWVDQIQDDWPAVYAVIETSRASYGDDMAAFLCWLGVRLIEMWRVLRPDGSLYLHCDDTASHYLKALLDGIFGSDCYRNHIIWKRATSHNDASNYGRILDHILFYGKSKTGYWDGEEITTPKTEAELKTAFPMKDSRGPVRSENLTGPRHSSSPDSPSAQPWRGYDVYSRGRVWSVPKTGHYAQYIEDNFIPGYRSIKGIHDRLDALDEAGLIHHPVKGVWPGLKRYAASDRGLPPQNLILAPTGFTNYNKGKGEYIGFPTQKPLAIYERLILASCPPRGVVLDPFAGCATTCVAAERLGRQWVGIDIWDSAHKTVLDRLESEGLAAPEGPSKRLLTFGDITYTQSPPTRTDDAEVSAPILRLKLQRPVEPWQKLTHGQIVKQLVEVQLLEGLVVCGGCGRQLEKEFMDLDHIQPRAEGGANDITNRILLCRPCNGRKRADLTLVGLRNANKRDGWMRNENLAQTAQDKTRIRAERVRDGLVDTFEGQD